MKRLSYIQDARCLKVKHDQYTNNILVSEKFGFRRNIPSENAAFKETDVELKSINQKILLPFDIFPTRCNVTQFIYFWKTYLHVSGGICTHHQEHTQLYLQYLILVKLLLLPATIVADSSNGFKSTRNCKYSCVCS